MGQDAKKSMTDLKDALKLIAAPVPPYLQKDFGAFKLAVSGVQSDLEKAVGSDEVAKARTGFKDKKPDYDKAKTQLQGWKTKVNGAVPDQKAAVARAKGKISEVNKAATKVIDLLKGKTGKEADLSKQIVKFANGFLPMIQSTNDPSTIDDVL